MSLSTHSEVLAKSREVQKYQKGERRSAVEMVNDVYETAMNNPRKLFSIVPGYKCRLCGGVILRRESFFPMLTPGGNIIKGCPKCKTMSYKMLNTNIVLDSESQ